MNLIIDDYTKNLLIILFFAVLLLIFLLIIFKLGDGNNKKKSQEKAKPEKIKEEKKVDKKVEEVVDKSQQSNEDEKTTIEKKIKCSGQNYLYDKFVNNNVKPIQVEEKIQNNENYKNYLNGLMQKQIEEKTNNEKLLEEFNSLSKEMKMIVLANVLNKRY